MIKYASTIFILGCLVACQVEQETKHSSSLYTWQLASANFEFNILEDSTDFNGFGKRDNYIKQIDIIDKKSSNHLQTIQPPQFDYGTYEEKDIIVRLEDVNFDGNTDIMVLAWLSTNHQKEYYYWLYNEETHQFVRDTTLEPYSNPSFHQDPQQIHSWARIGCCDYEKAKLVYESGGFELIEKEEYGFHPIDTSDHTLYYSKRMLIGDKWYEGGMEMEEEE